MRSHPELEARGGSWKETPTPKGATHTQGQGWRPGRSNPRSGGWQAQEGLEELSHVAGQEWWR